MPVRLGTLFCVIWIASAAFGEDQGSDLSADIPSPSSPAYAGEAIYGGLLIDDGVAVRHPYRVTMDEGQVAVNGIPLPRQTRVDWEESDDDDAPPRRRSATYAAGRLERQLSDGLVVVRTADGETAEFCELEALEFLRTLCSTESRERKLVQLLGADGQELNSRQWGRVLDRFEATDEVKQTLAQLQTDYNKLSEGLELVHDGSDRSHSYALTVAGMMLVVLAFGTVLTFRPVGGHPWNSLDSSASAVSHVVRCLVLIGILSGFDLLCTMLASRTSQFQELNPLAKLLLVNPQSLIGFKVALTGLAALILYRYRRYYGTQVASWWICLLLTLLTVRWVAVESLLMA